MAEPVSTRASMNGPQPAGATTSRQGRVAALVVASAAFLELKDTNALVVALPILASEFGVRPFDTSLLITSYIVILAVLIPLSGWFANRFGARLVFQGALVVFLAGSALCAMSTTLDELVAARVVQAMGGSFMTPVARLILVRGFPRGELVTLMAWFGIPMLLGPLLSPLIGGALAGRASWTWIFWMNLPLGALILLLSCRFVPPVPKLPPASLNWRSCMLLIAGLCTLMAGIEAIGDNAVQPPLVVALLAGGMCLLAVYAAFARKQPDAPLDLNLLRFPSFRLTMIGSLIFFVASTMLPFLVPILLQTVYHYDALTTGFIAVASVAGALIGRFCIGWLVATLTPVPFMVATVLLAGLSMASLAFIDARAEVALFALSLAVGGFCGSLHVTGLSAMAYSEIGDEKAGAATGFSGTIQQVSMAIGVAFAVILVDVMRSSRDAALTHADFAIAFILSGALCAAAALLYPRVPQAAVERLIGKASSSAAGGRR